MAALALQRIRSAQFSNELDVRIFVDNTTDQVLGEFEYVRDEYFPEATIYHAREHIFAPSGCWNILQSLQAGYLSGAEFVFLVEEDVMVYPDFFAWNFKQEGYFATCGRYRKEYGINYYTNPGACFKHDALGLVTAHINDAFFNDRRGYMDEVFGPMDEASDLDDGLIRRVIRSQSAQILCPDTPKVAHQGFHFYNKLAQYKVEGSITERVAAFRDLSAQVSPSERYARDFEPFHPRQ